MSLKAQIFSECDQLVEDRKSNLRNEIDELRNATGNETKSSAGDKYETSREMMSAEMERLSKQLEGYHRMSELLFQAKKGTTSDRVQLGSLVQTDQGAFLLAAPLGKITVDEKDVFVISTASPIGKLLLNKQVSDKVIFNNQEQQIIAVE